MSEMPFSRDDIAIDLWRLSKVGLIDVVMGEDGQWRYSVSDLYGRLSSEEVDNLIEESQKIEDPFS